jgi:hypothetical protein
VTEEELRTRIALLSGAKGSDEVDLAKVTIEAASMLLAVYQSAAADHELTWLEQTSKWLTLAASLVGPLASIASAVVAVAAASKAV